MRPRVVDNAREGVRLFIVRRAKAVQIVVDLVRRRGLRVRRVGLNARVSAATAAAVATKSTREGGIGGGRIGALGLGLAGQQIANTICFSEREEKRTGHCECERKN